MIACIFERVQWGWALNGSTAPRLGAAGDLMGRPRSSFYVDWSPPDWQHDMPVEIRAPQAGGVRGVSDPLLASSYLFPYDYNGEIWRSPTVFTIVLTP